MSDYKQQPLNNELIHSYLCRFLTYCSFLGGDEVLYKNTDSNHTFHYGCEQHDEQHLCTSYTAYREKFEMSHSNVVRYEHFMQQQLQQQLKQQQQQQQQQQQAAVAVKEGGDATNSTCGSTTNLGTNNEVPSASTTLCIGNVGKKAVVVAEGGVKKRKGIPTVKLKSKLTANRINQKLKINNMNQRRKMFKMNRDKNIPSNQNIVNTPVKKMSKKAAGSPPLKLTIKAK